MPQIMCQSSACPCYAAPHPVLFTQRKGVEMKVAPEMEQTGCVNGANGYCYALALVVALPYQRFGFKSRLRQEGLVFKKTKQISVVSSFA